MSAVVFVTVGAWAYVDKSKHDEMHLGISGDFIIGGTMMPRWQSEARVTQCIQPGDISHYPSVYFLPRADLKSLPRKEIRYHSTNQVNSSGTVVLPGDQDYLMWNSEILFNICLSHHGTSESSAVYTVVQKTNSHRKPVCKGDLPVSDFSKVNCTKSRVTCKVRDPGYYAIQLSLKAGTSYDANVQLITTYVNYSYIEAEVEKECKDITDTDCKLHVHLTDSEHVILVHIEQFPPYLPYPHTTHICVRYERSLFSVIFFVLFGVICLAIVISIICLLYSLQQCYLCTKRCKLCGVNKGRDGYQRLT